MKWKICVYVSEDLVSRLAVAAEHRGATKSGLVGAVLQRVAVETATAIRLLLQPAGRSSPERNPRGHGKPLD